MLAANSLLKTKVLFGSDATYLGQPAQVGRVVFARIGEADKRAILGLNLQRLLRLATPE